MNKPVSWNFLLDSDGLVAAAVSRVTPVVERNLAHVTLYRYHTASISGGVVISLITYCRVYYQGTVIISGCNFIWQWNRWTAGSTVNHARS